MIFIEVMNSMEKIKLLPLKEQEYMRRLFAGCTEEIRNHMFVLEVEEGKNFIKAGDKCRNIFIILKGRAKGIDASMVSAGCSIPQKDTTKYKIAMITDTGGVNDQAFNQLAWEGLQKFSEDSGADDSDG